MGCVHGQISHLFTGTVDKKCYLLTVDEMKVVTCKPHDRTRQELWHGSLTPPQRTQLQEGQKNIYSAAVLKETSEPNQKT